MVSSGTPPVEVRRSARRRKTVTVFRENGRLVALVPQRAAARDLDRIVPGLVERYLRREQERRPSTQPDELASRVQALYDRYAAPASGEPLPAFTVRWVSNQGRRWGSCTPADGTIRLSDRLQAMPGWVADYVMLHEAIHLVEHGHTRRFRDLLARYPLAERARGYLEGWQAGRGEPGE